MTTQANSEDRNVANFLAPPQRSDELGRLGPYRILKVIGNGSMGIVYKAEDPQSGRFVALKTMQSAIAGDATARKRFLREARAAAAIQHHHIVSIYQVGEDRGIPFITMELLKGQTLDDRLKCEGPLPIPELLRIGREMADGLAAVHDRGIIHRDIEPSNIWLEEPQGHVKILDFGLARSVSDQAHLTHIGAIIGTPQYMSPEQAGGQRVDQRSDLFSLGCIMFRMCTGKLPFSGLDGTSIISAGTHRQPPSPAELRSEMPRTLSDLVMRLLAKNSEDRPSSAREVADAL